MNCEHVLGLIDAGPFADYLPSHLEAAWRHARECPTCGPALELATVLTADLAGLTQPAPSPDLTASVLQRIVQIEMAATAANARATVAADERAGARDWSPWAIALGGLGAVLTMALSTRLGDALPIGFALPRVRGITASLIAMPPTPTAALALAVGLAVYIAGLFAPVRDER